MFRKTQFRHYRSYTYYLLMSSMVTYPFPFISLPLFLFISYPLVITPLWLLSSLLERQFYSIFIWVAGCVNGGKEWSAAAYRKHEDLEKGHKFNSYILSVSFYQRNNSRADGNETIQCISIKLDHILSQK